MQPFVTKEIIPLNFFFSKLTQSPVILHNPLKKIRNYSSGLLKILERGLAEFCKTTHKMAGYSNDSFICNS